MAGSQSGFPKKPFSPLMSNQCSVSSIRMLKTVHQRCVMRMRMSTMDVRMRLGDAIDPFQLANGFEAVIVTNAKNGAIPLSLTPMRHTSHARCDKASEWVGVIITWPGGRFREMIDSGLGWGGGAMQAGQESCITVPSTHGRYAGPGCGALDCLPFQGIARRSGIQVFRLYSRPSPVTDRNMW